LRPPNLREKKRQQQADKGAGGQQATITRKQAVLWLAGCGNQWSNPFPPPSLSSPARCCIYITVIEWPQIPAFLQLVEGRLPAILLQLVASCCGGCLATDQPSNGLYLILGYFDYQQLTQLFYTIWNHSNACY
jgi:hypothetical protein